MPTVFSTEVCVENNQRQLLNSMITWDGRIRVGTSKRLTKKLKRKIWAMDTHRGLCATPWTTAHQASPSITNSWSLLKLISIESVMPSNHLILCHPLVLPPSIFPSIRVFSNESVLCIRWPNYWSFSFSISPFNEYSGLISFRIDWFDRLAVQGTSRVFSNTRGQKHQFFST